MPRWNPRAAVTAAVTALTLGVAAVASAAPAPSLPVLASTTSLAPIDTSQHLRIMPLGDSITYGGYGSKPDSYRWDLWRYMVEVQQLTTVDFVGPQSTGNGPDTQHAGFPGWRIDNLSNQIDGWMATYNPDVVLLHAGVNDAVQGYGPYTMGNNLTVLVNKILAASPTVRVIVSDVLAPWYGTSKDIASATVQRYNNRLPEVLAPLGPRVSLARMSAAIPSITLIDGVHPGDDAYFRMAWVWWRCMAPILSADGITRSGVNPLPVPVPQDTLCPSTGA